MLSKQENDGIKLEIKNLSKRYANGVQALAGVNISIGKGMFGLLGQNGSGKSTVMRTIATLQSADEGSIFFDGIDVFQHPDRLRSMLGYLPQEFGVYPTVNAEEMLLHIADLKGIASAAERKSQAESLLKKVNLWEQRKKRLGTFSGGMKQRFGVAQALLGNPKLVIVDEPTAGLDPAERNRFYNLLSEIGENVVVILSTHIVDDVSTLCHEMAVMGGGKVLATGTPQEIQARLNSRLWKIAIEKHELESCLRQYDVISNRFYLGQLYLLVRADDKPGDGFEAHEPSLEDVYFSILADQQGMAGSEQ